KGCPHLAKPIFTAEVPEDVEVLEPAGDQAVRLMARDGAVAHVKKLSEVAGPGVWISTITAETPHRKAGATWHLAPQPFGVHKTIRFRVKGVYRSLAQSPVTPYWTNFFE